MKQLEDYRSAGEELYQKLRINTFPVAVKYIKAITEIPEGFTRPSAFGQKWSLCQAFTYARRKGRPFIHSSFSQEKEQFGFVAGSPAALNICR